MTDSNAAEATALFKRTEGGWVYRAPNPRIFGDCPHYLVDDAQRAEIIQILTPRSPARIAAIVIAAVVIVPLAMTALVWAFGSGADEPTAWDIAAIAGLVLMSLLPVLPVVAWVQLRRVRPVLAGAPVTSERITAVQIQRGVHKATSGKSALNALIAALFAFFAGASNSVMQFMFNHTGAAIFWAILAIIWGCLAVQWYRLTLIKVSPPGP